MLKNISTIFSEQGKKAPADTCRKPNLPCKIADYAPSAKETAKYVANHPEPAKRLRASSSPRFPALRNIDNTLIRAADPSSSIHSTLRGDRLVFSCPVPAVKSVDPPRLPRPLPVRNTGTLRRGRYRGAICPRSLHQARSNWFQCRFFENITSDSTVPLDGRGKQAFYGFINLIAFPGCQPPGMQCFGKR